MSSSKKKIISPQNISHALTDLHRPLVFTNGCFDILHRGHVTYLEQARQLGASLMVALNSDESIKRLGKGEDRPINPLADRMAIIAALQCVDIVTSFHQDTPLELIIQVKPDYLVKGGDWSVDAIVGSQQVIAAGGEVHAIAFEFQRSTSDLLNKIRQ